MALPQAHVVATAPLAILSAVVYPLNSAFGICNFVAVLFCGILMDVDHISKQRILRVLGKERVEIRGWQWVRVLYEFAMKVVRSLLKKQKSGKQRKGPVPEWINYFHTELIALWIAMIWLVIIVMAGEWMSAAAYLPIISYWIHILVDAAGRGQRIFNSSPLPKKLHRHFPERMTYEEKLPL